MVFYYLYNVDVASKVNPFGPMTYHVLFVFVIALLEFDHISFAWILYL